jgi:hypothetical protein
MPVRRAERASAFSLGVLQSKTPLYRPVYSRVCKASLPDPKARSKARFRNAGAERMCLHGKWGGLTGV